MNKNDFVKKYFDSWIEKDCSVIEYYFSDDVTYIESYGPVYKGKSQCLQWFIDWNKKGSVLKWDINNINITNVTCFIEWNFECDYENDINGFDGFSIIEFDKNDKITLVKEFQSKHEHHYPFGD